MTRLFVLINVVWIFLIAVVGSGLLNLGGAQENDAMADRLRTVMYLWLGVFTAGTVGWLMIHKRHGKCGPTTLAACCCFFGVPTCLCPGDNERLRVEALYPGRRSSSTPAGLVAPTDIEATCIRCQNSCSTGSVCLKCTKQVECLIAALPRPSEGPAPRPLDCVICCVEIGDLADVTVLPCEHAFHRDCIVPWLAQRRCPTCPVCRASLLDAADISSLLQL